MYYSRNTKLYPSAYITKRKSRLKIYNGSNVYLDDKDNFEIEMHNPTTTKKLCKIKLNGSYISTSGIVLNPGQRVFLERFLDSSNKFEFSTYEVSKTSENLEAISYNGDVTIEFYDQEEVSRNYAYNSLNLVGSTDSYYSGSINQTTLGPTVTTSFYTNSMPYASTHTMDSLSFLDDNKSNTLRRKSMLKKSIETGRVEKGEKSNQNFVESFDRFNSYTSHIVQYKILPTSTKNIEVHEIRNYCTQCGTKMKQNYKFCPTCGNKL